MSDQTTPFGHVEFQKLFDAIADTLGAFDHHQKTMYECLNCIHDIAHREKPGVFTNLIEPLRHNMEANLALTNQMRDLAAAANMAAKLPERAEGRRLAQQLGLTPRQSQPPEGNPPA